jgi:hypothetical protein
VAGDHRFDRDGRTGGTAGEWLVQGLGLGVECHRESQ